MNDIKRLWYSHPLEPLKNTHRKKEGGIEKDTHTYSEIKRHKYAHGDTISHTHTKIFANKCTH